MVEIRYNIVADNGQTIHYGIGSSERAEELADVYRNNYPENSFIVESYVVGEKYGR